MDFCRALASATFSNSSSARSSRSTRPRAPRSRAASRRADVDGRAILGVEATNAGSDAGLDAAMRAQAESRTGEAVEEHLMDGGRLTLAAVDRAAVEGVTIYAPVPTPRLAGVDRYAPRPTDGGAAARWRRRMGAAAAKRLYRRRAATIETVNGELKTLRGLGPLLVRGLEKVRCAALWPVLAYNAVHFGGILLSG